MRWSSPAVWLVFTVVLLVLGGDGCMREMGGTGASLDAALVYSNWVFAGAVLVWLFNALSAVIRGTGNMAVPAGVPRSGWCCWCRCRRC
jgi:Na+-driven multidrug efflux pump